jgi:[ribosomal protein S18]-alanine N-acetyltransferase
VTPPYRVDALSIEDGMDMAMWRYPGPWAVYDSLEAPRPDEGYWAVRDAEGELVGFCCFGEAARVLRPDLVGQGLGPRFVRTVVEHAETVAEGRRLRCVVPTWNEAGRRAAETAGFAVAGAHEIPGGAAVASYLVFLRA